MSNSRKIIVINAAYQLRLAKLMVGVTILTVNLLLIFSVLAPGLSGLELALSQKGAFVVAGAEVLLFTFAWFASLRLSHRVAGPIYAFNEAIMKVHQGDLTPHLRLRKKDEFKEVAESINQAIAVNRDRLLKLQDKIETAQKCSDVQEVQSALTEAQGIFKEFILAGKDKNETR